MQNQKDKHLDIPSEANREKHINFLEAEEETTSNNSRRDDSSDDNERRKEWQRGLAEGEKARNKDA